MDLPVSLLSTAPYAASGEPPKACELVKAQVIQAVKQMIEKLSAPLAVFSAAICLI